MTTISQFSCLPGSLINKDGLHLYFVNAKASTQTVMNVIVKMENLSLLSVKIIFSQPSPLADITCVTKIACLRVVIVKVDTQSLLLNRRNNNYCH